jgi:hypothetical protein
VIPNSVNRWRGTVTSSSRRSKRTGELLVYDLEVSIDGRGECTCPGYLFNGKNPDRNKPERERYKYRCEHLRKAFADLDGAQLPSETPGKPKRKRGKAPADPGPPRAFDTGLDDDAFVPLVRR